MQWVLQSYWLSDIWSQCWCEHQGGIHQTKFWANKAEITVFIIWLCKVVLSDAPFYKCYYNCKHPLYGLVYLNYYSFLRGLCEVNVSNTLYKSNRNYLCGLLGCEISLYLKENVFNVIVPFMLAGIGKLQTMGQIWLTVVINKVLLKQWYAFIYLLSMVAFMWQWQNWVWIEAICKPTKLEIFTIWHFRKCLPTPDL